MPNDRYTDNSNGRSDDDARRHALYQHRSRSRDGYAYHAGAPGPGPNLYHLRRDTRNSMIAGVCSGIAKHFGYPVEWVRIGWVAMAIFSGPLAVFGYIACAIFIKPEGRMDAYQPSPEEERFWRTFTSKPRASFSELKHRFRALDARISDMEYTVTSDEYGLRKAFSDLEKK